METKKDKESIDIKRYIDKYKANWKLVIISIVGMLFCATLFLFVAKKVFQVNATILIRDNEKGLSAGSIAKEALMKSFGSSFGLGRSSFNVDDEVQIVSSYSSLKEVVKKLDLANLYSSGKLFWKETYYQNSPIVVASQIVNAQDTLTKTIKVNIRRNKDGEIKAKATVGQFFPATIGEVKGSAFPLVLKTSFGNFSIDSTPFLQSGKNVDIDVYILNWGVAAEMVAAELDIKVVSKKTNTISLATQHTNPKRAKDILSEIIRVYDANVVEDKQAQLNSTVDFVQERLLLISEELSQAERKVESYKKDNKLSDVEIEVKVMLEKNSDFKEKMVEVETQLNVIDMIREYVSDNKNRYNLIPNGLGIDDVGLANAIAEYNTVLIERNRLLRNTGENNPILININEQVDLMRNAVLTSIDNVRNSTLIAKKDLDKQEADFFKRLKNMPTQEREFVDIKRDQLIKEQLFLFLMEKREENAFMLALAQPKTKVIDAPYMNAIPVFPKPKLIVLIALLLGALAPFVFILYKEFFGKKITGKDSVKDITSIPVLSNLNLSHENKNLLSMIRMMMLRINKIISHESSRIIGITTDRDEDGANLLAYELACGYAKFQQKTIIVDLNYNKPQIQTFFNTSATCDLYKFFNSRQQPDALVQNSTISEYLDYIAIQRPSGDIDSEVFSGEQFGALINYLEQKYKHIILRIGSLSDNMDLYYIAHKTDITLYVCKEEYSLKSDIQKINDAVNKQILSDTYIVLDSKASDNIVVE